MKPFRKILVPVDFSPHSVEAIRTAADLARHYEASMTVMHAYEPVSYAMPDEFALYTPEQHMRVLDQLEGALAKVKKDATAAGASHVETTLLQGIASFEITELARIGNFDLIVMGTHGRTGIKHALLGSVTERVLRRAPCPVLTVRAPSTEAAAAA